jgi:uncharacterized phage protein gp47/JayE
LSVNIKSQEQINADMLGYISDEYEKSTGFLTADLVKSNSIELAKVYVAIQELLNKVDIELLTGDELAKYVKQRKGIIKKQATFAKAILTINGTNATINVGDLFSTANNVQFESLETKVINGTDTIEVQCTQSGSIGMVGANSITMMPITIAGVTSVTNLQASYDGFEAESDVSLRSRYYEALQTPATSANIYHYLMWSKSIKGVGNAKVFPLWNGDNTVKVLIINADMQPTSVDLVSEVQNYIDPKGVNNETWGTGKGQAPIGAYCTVESAIGKAVNIEVDVDNASGYTLDEIKANIETKVKDYLKTIAFSKTVNYVSRAKIGQLILESEGVLDYRNLIVNGSATDNVLVADNEVAIVGVVTVS